MKPALGGHDVGQHAFVGGNAGQLNISRCSLPTCTEIVRFTAIPISLGQLAVAAQEIVLFPGKLRIAALHFEIFLGIPHAHHDDAAHLEAVGAHAGDVLRDVHIHAVDDGHDGDQGGGGQDDAAAG